MRRWLAALAWLAAGCVSAPTHPPTPPPAWRVQVYVHDAQDQPILSARVWRDLLPDLKQAVGPDSGAAWLSTLVGYHVCAEASGYVSQCLAIDQPQDATVTFRLDATAPVTPPAPTFPPAPLAALPPFPPVTATGDGVWSDEPYASTLPFDPPDTVDCAFHRGDFADQRIPDFTAGFNDQDRSLVMSWELPRFSPEDQIKILKQNARNGYTHFLLSIPQARNAGVLDQRFLDAAVRAKQYAPCLVVVAMGGDGESWTQDVLPWLDQLVALHAVDEVIVCWQGDKWYSPFDLISLTVQIGTWAHAHGLTVGQHWINDALAWWTPDDYTGPGDTCHTAWAVCDRFSYHRFIAQYNDFQWMQGDVNAPLGAFQWGIAKVLQSLTRERLVIAEYDAQREYDDPQRATEIQGALKGYLLLCAQGFGRVVDGGFMNGARLPNGEWVH